MSIVTVIGDGTTTTSLAVTSGWPGPIRPVVIEADPSGGSLAAWLDTPAVPSLATAVAQWPRDGSGGGGDVSWDGKPAALVALRPAIRRSPAGMSFVAAPVRAIAAARAVDEAADRIFPALAATDELTTVVDVGRNPGHLPVPSVLRHSDVVVACHRQSRESARASAVRLERFADDVVRWSSVGRPLVAAVIGDDPFDPDEIAALLASRTDGAPMLGHHVLADDPLAAAVLAGRVGVSARRMQRLPLMRSAADLATRIEAGVREQRGRAGEPASVGRTSG